MKAVLLMIIVISFIIVIAFVIATVVMYVETRDQWEIYKLEGRTYWRRVKRAK